MDLAKGHIAALRKLKEQCGCRVGRREKRGWRGRRESRGGSESKPPHPLLSSRGQIYNLGTGTGYSVLQMVRAMEKASGQKVGRLYPTPRRPAAPTFEVAWAPPTSLPDGHPGTAQLLRPP